jgi:hypothetical protein
VARHTDNAALRTIREQFIDELLACCLAAREGLRAESPTQRDRRVEDSFFRAAAALEMFISEWMIRCLSVDASQLRATFEGRAATEALRLLNQHYEPSKRLWRDKKATPTVAISIGLKKRTSLKDAVSLLGAADGNYSARAFHDLRRDVDACLVARFSRRLDGCTTTQQGIFDATVGIRNALAHRSTRATKVMNERIKGGRLPASIRRKKHSITVGAIGSYLRADGGGRPRFETYLVELAKLAHTLVPTKGRPRNVCP